MTDEQYEERRFQVSAQLMSMMVLNPMWNEIKWDNMAKNAVNGAEALLEQLEDDRGDD